MPVGDDGKQRPPRMEERLQAALDMWTKGDKDVAFATALNAIAYQSHGLAGLAKLTKQLEDKVAALQARVDLLPPPTTPPNVEM